MGAAGESAAVDFLVNRGLRLLGRNVRAGRGELDAVFADGATVVVVEVKTRSSGVCGSGLEAVTPAKMRTLRRTAARWLDEEGVAWRDVRFDVVEVVPVGDSFAVEWFRGVS